MAQAELRPANITSGNKIRIKLKGLNVKRAFTATGPSNAAGRNLDHLADLHAAVEAFCQQGVNSLPGGVLLSPWREPDVFEPVPSQQDLVGMQPIAGVAQQQQEQPVQPESQPQHTSKRRVRKRRMPDPDQIASDAAAGQPDAEQVGWGGIKRRRSAQHRAARDTAQLSNSIHSMLQPSSAPGSPSIVSQPAAAAAVPAVPNGPLSSSRPVAASSKSAEPAKRSRLQRASQEAPAVPVAMAPAAAAAPAAGLVPAAEPGATAGPPGEALPAAAIAVQLVPVQEATPQGVAEQAEKPDRPEQLQEQQPRPEQQSKQEQQQPKQEEKPISQQQQVHEPKPMQVEPEPAQLQPAAAVEAAAVAVEAAVAEVATEQVQKPASPPSETSHQQHIAPQQMQQLLPKLEVLQSEPQSQVEAAVAPAVQTQPQSQPQAQPGEQTAVSRDRSQCSLQRADAGRGTAAVNMPAPVSAAPIVAAVTAAGAPAAPSGRLLELAPGSLTPAAQALASLSAVPEVKQRCLPPEGIGRTQEEALQYLARMMEKAKQLKHQGDKRQSMLKAWDVFGLSFYALSTVEFLLYWDTALRLLDRLSKANQPVDKLQHQVNSLSNSQFLRQTGALSTTGMNHCSNCKGPDVAKQALRMLLERLSAISNMRNLHSQRRQLEGHVRLLKSNGSSIGSSSTAGAVRLQQQQQQAQQGRLQMQAQRAAAAAAVGKPPSPSGGSWSPAGQQAFNKRSPDDSNASNQERVQLPVGGEQPGSAAGAAAGLPVGAAGHTAGVQAERALHLAKSERQLMDTMQELLRMTDGMHQTVMRMQQFLESPDVLASEHARAAALHISVLGLDAGMFSIPRVAAHTEAAVMCITKLLRTS